MLRWAIITITIGVILVITGALAGQWLLPAVVPPSPTQTPRPLETAVDAEPIAATHVLVDVRKVVLLNLTPAWQVSYVDAGESVGTLRHFASVENGPRRQAARSLLSGLADDATILAATHATLNQPTPDTTLLVLAMERNGLGLDRYLEDMRNQLTEQGASILTAEVNTDYRMDHLPVALVSYTLPTDSTSATTASQNGLQLAAFDRTGDLLVLFTLNTTAEHAADLAPLAADLLRSAQFY
jgi:hypothetical protein